MRWDFETTPWGNHHSQWSKEKIPLQQKPSPLGGELQSQKYRLLVFEVNQFRVFYFFYQRLLLLFIVKKNTEYLEKLQSTMSHSHRTTPSLVYIQRKMKRRPTKKKIPIICYMARILLQNSLLFHRGFKLLVRKSVEIFQDKALAWPLPSLLLTVYSSR